MISPRQATEDQGGSPTPLRPPQPPGPGGDRAHFNEPLYIDWCRFVGGPIHFSGKFYRSHLISRILPFSSRMQALDRGGRVQKDPGRQSGRSSRPAGGRSQLWKRVSATVAERLPGTAEILHRRCYDATWHRIFCPPILRRDCCSPASQRCRRPGAHPKIEECIDFIIDK